MAKKKTNKLKKNELYVLSYKMEDDAAHTINLSSDLKKLKKIATDMAEMKLKWENEFGDEIAEDCCGYYKIETVAIAV